jgi:chorismate dehydratase
MSKVRLTAVNYINTKPFIYGLIQAGMEDELEMYKDIPAVCADKLIKDEVDIALIPVAALAQIKDHYIVSDYCIGCDGEVKTVCLFSNNPIEKINRIYLDTHSRTSAALTKVLVKEYWKKESMIYKPISEIENVLIDDDSAILAIGDKTIGMQSKYRFTYDLGIAWKDMTGLPFVFAAWVSNKKLEASFLERFNTALAQGLSHIPDLLFILPEQDFDFDLKKYFEENISYKLDEKKKEALRLFMTKLNHSTSSEDVLQPIFA